MDIWKATNEQIQKAARKYFNKEVIEVSKQSGLWAFVTCSDGTYETVYDWMVK